MNRTPAEILAELAGVHAEAEAQCIPVNLARVANLLTEHAEAVTLALVQAGVLPAAAAAEPAPSA